jgi:hypothetical protein
MVSETRYMRNALNDNKTFPSSYNIVSGSLASGSLANLQASDDVYMVFNSALVGSNQVVEVEFLGSISGHLPFVQVAVEGKGSVGVYLQIAVYNYENGAYESAGTMFYDGSFTTSDSTKYLYNLLGNKKYRDANGNWKVKVKAWTTGSPPPSFQLSLDYLCFRSVCFQLGTTQTTVAAGNDTYVDGLTVGIRVFGIKTDESEEEIGTAETLKATVTGPSATVTLSATWNCPATANYIAFLVIVYRISASDFMRTAALDAGGLPLAFMTEDLNSALASATWTVYYAFYYNAALDQTFFRFGTTTYNSRIVNFTWGILPTVVKKPLMDGFVYVE